jgi:membrane-associated phospholipid phosphatase
MLLIQLCWSRPYRALHVGALATIIASTVLVKQHYVVDLLAAGLVYAASAAFLARLEITGVDASGWALARGSRGRPEGGQGSA